MRAYLTAWCCLISLVLPGLAFAEVRLVAKAVLPGHLTDRSGLTGKLADGTPGNLLGGLGSGIAYTGKDDLYLLVADRGPKDGASDYLCRFHTVKITLADGVLQAALQATTLFRDENDRPLPGSFAALAPTKKLGGRFDPEGVRVSSRGTLYVADEYGPFIDEFDQKGKRLQRLPIPAHFQVKYPDADPKAESKRNIAGREPNRGMEGLALTPDGRKLVAILQSPLIQDGGRQGSNVRILEIDLVTRKTREFLYPLQSNATGVSEILAVNDHEFLVLERDGQASPRPFCKIFKIDLARATDIHDRARLPAKAIPEGVVPVTKQLFLDLHDPRLGLKAGEMPIKVEGLAFGPDFADGRHLLLVTTDNDFDAKQPTRIFAFACDRSDLPGLQRPTGRP